ncbi:MAG: sigma-70 family RNA polymerase sigma factor [Ktedonobacterales bacterium]|nr:sigma-70 family RNA polymerase sigma factor [Ktedonobacterales bacterium]
MAHIPQLVPPEELAIRLDAARPLDERLAALDALVVRLQAQLMTYLRQQIPDGEARLDCHQEIWRAVTEAIRAGEFHDRGIDPRAYIFRFARNRVKQYQTRDRRHLHQDISLSDELAEELAAEDVCAHLDDVVDFDRYFYLALERVPPDDHAILAIWRQADASLSEIAAQFGRSHRAVWDIVQRFARAFQHVCPHDPREYDT